MTRELGAAFAAADVIRSGANCCLHKAHSAVVVETGGAVMRRATLGRHDAGACVETGAGPCGSCSIRRRRRGLAWEKLKSIVPHELSQHWEKTLAVPLGLLTEGTGRRFLQDEKASDPAAHRDAALRQAAAEAWKRQAARTFR